jgi:stage V sporulation protein B
MEKKMAKGTVWLMIAMIIFMGSGYIIHIGLARVVSPDEYGIYGVILSLLAITEIFLQNGVPQSVSKFVAEGGNIKIIKSGFFYEI